MPWWLLRLPFCSSQQYWVIWLKTFLKRSMRLKTIWNVSVPTCFHLSVWFSSVLFCYFAQWYVIWGSIISFPFYLKSYIQHHIILVSSYEVTSNYLSMISSSTSLQQLLLSPVSLLSSSLLFLSLLPLRKDQSSWYYQRAYSSVCSQLSVSSTVWERFSWYRTTTSTAD